MRVLGLGTNKLFTLASVCQWQKVLFPFLLAEDRILTDLPGSSTRKAIFSFQSAYKVARDLCIATGIASSSNGDRYVPNLRPLWRAEVPKKVAIFAWRAVHTLLPTRKALSRKGYTGELNCVVCHHHVESLEHLYCTCNLCKEGFGIPLFSFTLTPLTWKDWILERATLLSCDMFDKFLVLLWSSWLSSNDLLWNNKGMTHDQ